MLKRTIKVIGDRPTEVRTEAGNFVEVPADAEIWNAPRPLCGPLRWQDTKGRTGWFHSAITPGDDYADDDRERCIQLDARRLEFVSEADAVTEQLYVYASKVNDYVEAGKMTEEDADFYVTKMASPSMRRSLLNDYLDRHNHGEEPEL